VRYGVAKLYKKSGASGSKRVRTAYDFFLVEKLWSKNKIMVVMVITSGINQICCVFLAVTFEPEALESQSSAQKTQITA